MLAVVVGIDFVKRYRVVASSGKLINVLYVPGEMKVEPATNTPPLLEWEIQEAVNMVWAAIREGK